MKIRGLKAQKILLWIPIANMAIFFIWVVNYIFSFRYLSKLTFFLSGILTIASIFVITELEYFLWGIICQAQGLHLTLIITYIVGLTVGLISLASQHIMMKLYAKQGGQNVN